MVTMKQVPVVGNFFFTTPSKKNTCQVNHNELTGRTSTVAAIGFGVAALIAVTSALIFPLGLAILATAAGALVVIVTFIAFHSFDRIRANSSADSAAVKEFLQKNQPSHSAFERLVTSYQALRSLARSLVLIDLNKTDDRNETLLDHFAKNMGADNAPEHFALFKLLIDKSAPAVTSTESGKAFFAKAVESDSPFYVSYMIKKNKVSAADFTEGERTAMMSSAGNEEIQSLLEANGF